ncbi:MAG: hypothetical protein ACOX52_23105 [Verrucomicrobiota bacterium]|jgi:hypothetical protein
MTKRRPYDAVWTFFGSLAFQAAIVATHLVARAQIRDGEDISGGHAVPYSFIILFAFIFSLTFCIGGWVKTLLSRHATKANIETRWEKITGITSSAILIAEIAWVTARLVRVL